MAGDTIIIPKNAMMMIHKAWTFGVGNSDDFHKLAEDLEKIEETIIAAYQDKTGLEKDKIIEMMKAETWLTAKEAVENGFADEIEQEKQVAASLNGGILMLNGQRMDLSRFNNAPKLVFLGDVEPPKDPEDPPAEPIEEQLEEPEEPVEKQNLLSIYESQIQINKNWR
jgi:hypothetical protein